MHSVIQLQLIILFGAIAAAPAADAFLNAIPAGAAALAAVLVFGTIMFAVAGFIAKNAEYASATTAISTAVYVYIAVTRAILSAGSKLKIKSELFTQPFIQTLKRSGYRL